MNQSRKPRLERRSKVIKKKNLSPPCMWYDQGTTEPMTDGWIVISWLVTWGCRVDFSSLAHLLGTCHFCLIFPSRTPLIGIAFYRTRGRSVQSKAMSDEETCVCISLLSCFTWSIRPIARLSQNLSSVQHSVIDFRFLDFKSVQYHTDNTTFL